MNLKNKAIPRGIKCTAKSKRSGKQCRRWAMRGKDKCAIHGGKTPIKHGLYSKYATGTLADHIEELVTDPKLTRLEEVIATQAALLRSHLTEAGVNPSAKENVLEVSKALVNSIEKWHKITYGEKQVIRIEGLKSVTDEIVNVITEYVPDKKKHPMILKRIENRIMGIGNGSRSLH